MVPVFNGDVSATVTIHGAAMIDVTGDGSAVVMSSSASCDGTVTALGQVVLSSLTYTSASQMSVVVTVTTSAQASVSGGTHSVCMRFASTSLGYELVGSFDFTSVDSGLSIARFEGGSTVTTSLTGVSEL